MRDVIYHDRTRESRGHKAARIWGILLALLVLACLVIFLLGRIGTDQNDQAIASLKQNVKQAAVQCYAIEGSYPSDITYLEQNYGVSYNAAKYTVKLTPSEDGSLPDVEVTAR